MNAVKRGKQRNETYLVRSKITSVAESAIQSYLDPPKLITEQNKCIAPCLQGQRENSVIECHYTHMRIFS